jgi:hypothetical protein
MPVFISIGDACSVKYQIDKHVCKKETFIFDRVITDMNTVIKILNNYNNIDDIINVNSIIKHPYNPVKADKSRITIKCLTKFVSIHDISIDMLEAEVCEFIETYKRRLIRVIDYIMGDEKIFFVRFGEIKNNEKVEFINAIKKINPNCDFSLVGLNNNEDLLDKNIMNINLDKYLIKEIDESDWSKSYYDWKPIFNGILSAAQN